MNNEKFESFEEAIEEGDKITLVKFNEFGFPYVLKTIVKSVEFRTYGQYPEVLQIIHKPLRKRSDYKLIIKPFEQVIIWKGWHEVDAEMYRSSDSTNGVTTRTSLSCFSNEYMEIALNSIKVKPILANRIFNKEMKNDFIYQISSSEGTHYFSYEEIQNKFVITGNNKRKSSRLELQNQPIISGHSPMWGGYHNGKGVIRYEFSGELQVLLVNN